MHHLAEEGDIIEPDLELVDSDLRVALDHFDGFVTERTLHLPGVFAFDRIDAREKTRVPKRFGDGSVDAFGRLGARCRQTRSTQRCHHLEAT